MKIKIRFTKKLFNKEGQQIGWYKKYAGITTTTTAQIPTEKREKYGK